jgi:hypothetical protein
MSHLFLSHLSKNNNCPRLVERLFTQHADSVKMIVASRYEETAVYHITDPAITTTIQPYSSPQLSFAFA